jgi:hypothetical protein
MLIAKHSYPEDNTMSRVDRRRVERFDCSLEIEEVNGRPCPYTFLKDISHLGAQLETSYHLAIGNPIDFGLSLPPAETDKKAYHFAGQVVWIMESGHGPKRYRVGVSFLKPFSETTKILGQLH